MNNREQKNFKRYKSILHVNETNVIYIRYPIPAAIIVRVLKELIKKMYSKI